MQNFMDCNRKDMGSDLQGDSIYLGSRSKDIQIPGRAWQLEFQPTNSLLHFFFFPFHRPYFDSEPLYHPINGNSSSD